MSVATEPDVKRDRVDRLDSTDNGLLMSPLEFDAVREGEDFCRFELIRGVVIVSPSPSESERDINDELGHWFRTYRERHPEGKRLHSTLPEHDIRIGDDRRRADRGVWIGGDETIDRRIVPPTIVIEIVSPGSRNRRRDYLTKRDAYLGLAVREYWVIDRFQKSMTVFVKTDVGVTERKMGVRETYRTDLLPGFELVIGKLLGMLGEEGQVSLGNA